MRPARTLRDLLTIRLHHLQALRAIPGFMGSAVGYRYSETRRDFARDAGGQPEPVVLVFVKQKLPPNRIAPGRRVPATFSTPTGLACTTDVIEGSPQAGPPGATNISQTNERLRRQLIDGPLPVIGGISIASSVETGTAACVVSLRGRRDELGLLTAWHVAGIGGDHVLQPPPRPRSLGLTERSVLTIPSKPRSRDSLAAFAQAEHRVDAAFIRLSPSLHADCRHGVFGLDALGAPHTIDLDSMDLVGRQVLGIGQTLGRQEGHIAAYGYEWQSDEAARTRYVTDYLIVGSDGKPFAAAGDSGKLVVTADPEHRPVALLWGGQRQGIWTAHAQQTWAYASAIGVVQEALGIDIVSAQHSNGATAA